ncbi:MAG: sulfatase-like hydrolase/transferase [Planctomycetes bacterium]|nr:sulfatase-like hydrolase/transferase [Planctomycetota bacterium]
MMRGARAAWPIVPCLLSLAACGDASTSDAAIVASPDAPIVLLLVPLLRSDHTGFGGGARDTTPFLDSLADESVVFERAYAAAASTRASVASLLTGRLPPGHGCERDGMLGDEIDTLPETLSAAGWRTHGIVANGALSSGFGFGQGFDTYQASISRQGDAALDARGLGSEAIAVLDDFASDGRPWLLEAVYGDLLLPWRAHDADLSPPFDADAYRRSRWTTPPDDVRTRAVVAYDGEIRFVDDALRALFAQLAERAVLEHAWVVVTSVGGPGLWDHGANDVGHDVFESSVHVPLFVRPPGGLPGGRRVSDVISQVDVMPTLLELVGVPDTSRACDGRSWAGALLHGEPAPVRPALVVQRTGPVDLRAAIDDRSKLVIDLDPERRWMRLVDLAADRGEHLGDALDPTVVHSGEADRLQRALDERIDLSLACRPERPPPTDIRIGGDKTSGAPVDDEARIVAERVRIQTALVLDEHAPR